MILTVGRLPSLTRCDWPTDAVYGSTIFPWPEDQATQDLMPEFVISVLLGPLAAGAPDWPPAWPPDREERGPVHGSISASWPSLWVGQYQRRTTPS
jgi:hypothetical protein